MQKLKQPCRKFLNYTIHEKDHHCFDHDIDADLQLQQRPSEATAINGADQTFLINVIKSIQTICNNLNKKF